MTEHVSSSTYRQGLTLGLTMAEIFILILFLLLLLLLALYGFNAKVAKMAKDVDQTQAELEEMRKELQEVTRERDRMRREQPKEIQRLQRKITEMTNELKVIENEKNMIQSLLEKSRESEKDLDKRLKASKKLLSGKEKELVGALANAEAKSVENAEKAATLEKALANAQAENEDANREITRLRTELYARKGIDPPCWYQVVERRGRRHEKPHYLLDVAVHDAHLRVKLLGAPQGRAIDESGRSADTSYEEEYAALPLDPLMTVRNFSLAQFREATGPIRSMGRNERIRDYSCVFYAKVWDFTSTTAKKRWQEAEDAIKHSFYIFRVREDPWPWQ